MLYNDKNEPVALVTNIQGYTIHDGPGIRTEIFLKGCPLHCPWCSNPEGLKPSVELGIYPSKCIEKGKCSFCTKLCPLGGSPIKFDENGIITAINMETTCKDCLKCAAYCPSGAIKIWGEKRSVPELMKVIKSDMSFYERTGGGVTVSGGEALLHWDFLTLLLKECKASGIHTCVESALFVPTEHVDAVMEYTDLLITDIKFFDSDRHKEVTGVPNELILKNIKHVKDLGIPIVIRTPVVMGYNDDDENMLAIGEFIESLGERVIQYQLLPYRKMGTEKYETLGLPYPLSDYIPPEREVWEANLLRIKDMLGSKYNIPVVAGSSNKLPGY